MSELDIEKGVVTAPDFNAPDANAPDVITPDVAREEAPEKEIAETGNASPQASSDEAEILSAFDPDDPEFPQNYSLFQKALNTIVMTTTVFTVAMSSAIFAPGIPDIMEKYNVTREVALLPTAMVLVGYAVGSLIWAPSNDVYGRKVTWFTSTVLFCLFQIPTGVNPNLQTLIIGRFFQGAWGVSALVSFGGSMNDIWNWKHMNMAASIAVSAIFAAPAFGPTLGSFFVEWVNFGWLSWIVLILSGVCSVSMLFVKETSAAHLLRDKALRLQKEGRNVKSTFVPITVKDIITRYCVRPIIMFVTDKALAYLISYAALAYALLYAMLVAFPVAFQEYRDFEFILRYVPSVSILVGVLITAAVMNLSNGRLVRRRLAGIGGPDDRLELMMFGAISLPIGLFIFAWTAPFRHVHWMGPVVGGTIVGFATSSIFMSTIMYILEVYRIYAISALSANAIMRSMVAVLLLLVLTKMIERMTFQGAFSFFGGLAILIAPGPFILHRKGRHWRKSSKWSFA